MTKHERLAAALICALLVLWVGLTDHTDPTPSVLRCPIVWATAVGMSWVVWRWSGEQ
jgi:hypothetical protein